MGCIACDEGLLIKSVTWHDAKRLAEQTVAPQETSYFAFKIKVGPARQNAKSVLAIAGDPLRVQTARSRRTPGNPRGGR